MSFLHWQLADSVGPFICLLKTHVDILHSFPDAVAMELKALASKHQFVVMEDRYVVSLIPIFN